MSLDLGRYLRLRGAVMSVVEGIAEAAAEAAPAESSEALVQSYRLLRAEVREQAGWEFVEEYDRLFPDWDELAPSSSASPLADYQRARLLLLQLVGWLEGFVEQAELETEARAYAEARLEKEHNSGGGAARP